MDTEAMAAMAPEMLEEYCRYRRIAQDMTPEDRRLFRVIMAHFLGDSSIRRIDGRVYNAVALANNAFRDEGGR